MVVASAGWAMVICVGSACASAARAVSNRATRQAKSGIGLPPLFRARVSQSAAQFYNLGRAGHATHSHRLATHRHPLEARMKGVTLPTETVFVMENSPIKFGLGAMDEIGFDASRLGIRKALFFTDRHIAELGLPERVRALLEEQGVKADVWDGVEVEPTDRSMEEAGEYARSKEFDGLIAVGGGSTIDTCKAANLLTCYPAPLLDYINKPVGKGVPVPGPVRPLTAAPGADILTHAIESYTTRPYNARAKHHPTGRPISAPIRPATSGARRPWSTRPGICGAPCSTGSTSKRACTWP